MPCTVMLKCFRIQVELPRSVCINLASLLLVYGWLLLRAAHILAEDNSMHRLRYGPWSTPMISLFPSAMSQTRENFAELTFRPLQSHRG